MNKKRKKAARKKKNKRRKKSHKSKCKKNGEKKIKVEPVDCQECAEERTLSPVDPDTEPPEVEELEMFLQSEPDALPALHDLIVNKNLTQYVRETPPDVYRLLAEYPEHAPDIFEANIDVLLTDEEFLKMLYEEYPGGLEEFFEKK